MVSINIETIIYIKFYDFSVQSIMDYGSMQGPLRNLAAAGAEVWQELQDTKEELEQTKEELRVTKLELAATKAELSDARDQIDTLTQELNETRADLDRAQNQVTDLESQVATLRNELDALNERVLAVEDERDEWMSRYESCDAELKACMKEGIGKDVVGQILLVNPEWNFVVIDIGKDRGLAPPAEMLVHRDDNLVGRIRLSTVLDEMSVGEIMGEWEQRAVRTGDYVISPDS